MALWRIWYSDGSTFSSENGEPSEAPREGVQAIAERRDGRRLVWVYGDVYGWTGEGWQSSILPKKGWPDGAAVLEGEEIDFDLFRRIRVEAIEWLDRLS
jgi:hypothetical protein